MHRGNLLFDGYRVVYYARVSTEEEEQLNAIELQIEENRTTIRELGGKLVDEYVDRGKSGTTVKRGMSTRDFMKICAKINLILSVLKIRTG